MYLSELKLWNFRRFGSEGIINVKAPNLDIVFKPGINVLVGENDSGKTAIVDAIRLVLKTHALEWIHVERDDFYSESTELRIELIILGFKDEEASHFTEWLGWDTNHKPFLRLIYGARRDNEKIIPTDIMAGVGDEPTSLKFEAREYLKVTFLKALRDAENEMSAKRNSRVSQILKGHELLAAPVTGNQHPLEKIFSDANVNMNNWFEKPENKTKIHDVIDKYLQKFTKPTTVSKFEITDPKLRNILEKISIVVQDEKNPGLGSLNRLYMAIELLHLQKQGWTGLKLCLIEEIEAHLHPQAQMKVIEALQDVKDTQFILTTHSPNITSKLKISNSNSAAITLCKNEKVYPLWPEYTNLGKSDYSYLEHFLDVTKSSMFFAHNIILVEGWAEEILLPVIAKKMGKDLAANEVSIINVGSTAYLHFAKIFTRQDNCPVNYKVAIVTDLDIRPDDDGSFDNDAEQQRLRDIESKIDAAIYSNIKWCVAKHWTLEWCLYKSTTIGQLFRESVKETHPRIFVEESCFENNLIERLRKYRINEEGKHISVDELDKVGVASNLAQKILVSNDLNFATNDESIEYLKDAINFVC